MKQFKKQRYALVFTMLGLWTFLLLKVDLNYLSLRLLKQNAFYLHTYAQKHFYEVLYQYMLIFITATASFIPVTIIMTILGGFLFGSVVGAVCSSFAAALGGSIVLLFVRNFARDWVRQNYADRFAGFHRAFQKHGARYLLSLQISPVTPTFFINLFVGLTNVSLWTYIWTTFLGMLPGSFIYALAGQKLQAIDTPKEAMPPLIFVILFIASFIGLWPLLRRRLRRSPDYPVDSKI